MQFNEKLKEAVSLYNGGKYLESHKILIFLWVQASGEEKKLYEALLKVVEGMNFVSSREWEKAKDIFLAAWRQLREAEAEFIDVDRLKEESYTAAVAAERIIIGEAEWDSFYTPKINVVE